MGEMEMRANSKMDPLHVLETLRGPSAETFAVNTTKLGKLTDGRDLSVYCHGIVMPQGDRSLRDIHDRERPLRKQCCAMARQIAASLQHVHEQGIVHCDVKMANVLRLHSGLHLIDFDSAVSFRDGHCAGAKFSSSTLAPEMFVRMLTAAEVQQHETYYAHEAAANSAVWRKVRPVAMSEEGKTVYYAVRAHQESQCTNITVPALPYQLHKAHPTLDVFALGILLFELFCAVSFFPTDRDDDLAGLAEVGAAASLTDEKVHTVLQQHAGELGACLVNLLTHMLRVDPKQRLQSMEDVLCHPFFYSTDTNQLQDGHRSQHDMPGESQQPQHTGQVMGKENDLTFTDAARRMQLTPIDYHPEITDNAWQYNKLSLRLLVATSSLHWGIHDAAVAHSLCALARKAIRHSINLALRLPDEIKSTLNAQIKHESEKFRTVQKSIFENLVKNDEVECFAHFSETFSWLSSSLQAAGRRKAAQTTGDVAALVNKAAQLKPQVDEVS